MADVKISALPAATTPLGGTELVPIVQGGVTTRVSVDNLTAGRTVAASTVNVDANTASAAVRITQTGAGNALLVEDSASPDANPFVVTADGRVGVGTSAPNVGLDVFGSQVRSSGATGGSYAQLNGGNVDGANIQLNRAGSATQNAFLGQFQGSLFLKNLDSGPIVFTTTTSDTERMRITNTGDVGIGTGASTPQARLDVAGRIWSTPPAGGLAGMSMYTAAASGFVPGQIAFTRASATGGATPNNSAIGEFRFDGRDANGSYTSFASISAEMFTNAAGGAPGSMAFFISASGASAQERMRLTSQGLGVGSTTFGTSAERVLSIGTGVAPTTGPADTIQIYSTDLSAGNTILSLFTEGAGATNAGITNTTVTNKIAVRINGTVYYLLATTNGT